MTDGRARDLGVRIGRGTPGPINAITDVAGVRVGHRTIVEGPDGAARRRADRRHRRLRRRRHALGGAGLRRDPHPERVRRADRRQHDPRVGHPREPDRADQLPADRGGLRRHGPVDRRPGTPRRRVRDALRHRMRRLLALRGPRPPAGRRGRLGGARCRRERPGPGGLRRRRDRHAVLRLQGRHRHRVAGARRRRHGGCAGPHEPRRPREPPDRRRAGGRAGAAT